ncbi:hypothetical protein Y919_04240 [Caloranaerobacter azorensis H53214]|uniref:Uncharacterized protein n=1 Tax=Caloranaerobacter azorensis H53214 TaxID=1156417 RepID=A0A096BHX9_9FIRM|nr:hypothetical protein [Caloranaerobacter azorensis]KGG80805.1 hypothetical protein Y919_04240 [Caloranaerobacter azorensis H53214]
MNKLQINTQKQINIGPLNNKLLLFAALIFMPKLINQKFSLQNLSKIYMFNNLDKKIHILKKIGPYLPEQMIGTLNIFIVNLEKINKIIGLYEFITIGKTFEPITPVTNITSKERINKIFQSLQEEIPDDKLLSIKPMLDLMMNIDKFKPIISTLTKISSANDKSEINIDDMIDLIKPMLGDEEAKNIDKMKDMLQMMELLSVLNSSDEN